MTSYRHPAGLRTFTATDRALFPGAPPFRDGREPLIGTVGAVIMTADGQGVTLHWGDGRSAFVYGPTDPNPFDIREFARDLFSALAGF